MNQRSSKNICALVMMNRLPCMLPLCKILHGNWNWNVRRISMLIPNLVILRQICCQDLHGKIQASKKWALLTPSATFTLCSINCQIPAACQMLLAWLQPNKIKCAIHFQCWRKKKQVIRHWTPLHWSLCLKGRHPRNTLQIKCFNLHSHSIRNHF